MAHLVDRETEHIVSAVWIKFCHQSLKKHMNRTDPVLAFGAGQLG